ncbi:MAG: InlB B-repeat-containing protein, partial [Oscillospiraceae bacterium]
MLQPFVTIHLPLSHGLYQLQEETMKNNTPAHKPPKKTRLTAALFAAVLTVALLFTATLGAGAEGTDDISGSSLSIAESTGAQPPATEAETTSPLPGEESTPTGGESLPAEEDGAEQPSMRVAAYALSTTATAGTAQEFEDAFADPGILVIELTANIPLTATQTLPTGKTLTVTSAAGSQYSLTMATPARHFVLENGSHLTLEQVTLDGQNALGGVEVKSTNADSSSLTLQSAAIINCWAPSTVYGGAISGMSGTMNATITIGGSSLISGNKGYWGGGIAVSNSYLTIEGDTLIQNNALSGLGGGGVLAWGAILTVRGNAQFLNNNIGSAQPGGAIYLYGSQAASISGNVKFEGNRAWVGGAIAAGSGSYNYTGTLTIADNVSFVNNYASGDGGAIYMHAGSTANIGTNGTSSILFSKNASYANGGAIYRYNGTLNVGAGTQFLENTIDLPYRTGASGGAIYVRNATFTVTGTSARRVMFRDGRAASCGGALCLIEGTTTNIAYADFINNHSRNFGGAIDIDSSTATNNVTLDNCLLDGNWCDSTGGGIAVEVNSGNLTVTNSILRNNSAGGQPHDSGYRYANGTGGAIYFEQGRLIIQNSSITGNASAKHGGGISKSDSASLLTFLSSITISGTTFSGNTANALYNMTDPTYSALHATNVNPGEGAKTYSQGLAFAYNNFDISYQNDGALPLPQVTVTYDATGGSPTPASQTVNYGDGADRPATNPTRPHATFTDWVTEAGYPWGFNSTPGANDGAPVRSA